MNKIYVGYVTGLHARDQRSSASAVDVEAYVPSAAAGQRTKRWHLSGVADNRALVMVSLLRDALIHRLPVSVAVDDAGALISAVEVHVPARETYETGKTARVTGRIQWLAVDEVPMGSTERGQPDLATVVLDGQPTPLYLVLERRNSATKQAQFDLLERARGTGAVVTLDVLDYSTGPGVSVKVIIAVGVGTPPKNLVSKP